MKKERKPNSALAFWDSACIAGSLLLLVFLLKQIWPFGSANVTYGDMAQGTLPVIYHIYDWMHGEKALLFDWYSGLGVSMAASYSVTPFDLILYLFRREHLIYALGVIVWLKSVTAAFTARLSFERMFPKAPTIWKLLFSVSYALSGYAMTYYTNFSWLDFILLFPLLLWGLKRLMDENKPLLYTVCYAVGLYLSFYQGYMITLAVFFLGGLYLLTAVERKDAPQRTVLFGAATFVGALLSCFHSVPFALLSLSSQRFNKSMNETGNEGLLVHTVKQTGLYFLDDKLMLLIGLEFAAAFALLFLLRSLHAKKIKQAAFIGGGIVILFAQVVFENTNLFWHGGDYVQFPMRFFYVSVFFLLCLALAYLERYGETLRPFTKKAPKMIYRVIILLLSAAFLALLVILNVLELSRLSALAAWMIVFTLGLVIALLSVQQDQLFTRMLCTVLVLAECTGIAYYGIANNRIKTESEFTYKSESYVDYCREAGELDLSTSVLGRIRNPDTSLNTNYPFLTKTQALSNWTHFIPYYLQRAACALGYSNQYTRLLDSGGTIFSDTLLNMEKAVARNTFRMPAGYSLLEKGEAFSVYRNDYALPLGFTADDALLTDLTAENESAQIVKERFDTQNELFHIFAQTQEDLVAWADSAERTADRIELERATAEQIVFTYVAGQNEILYLNACGFKFRERVFVQVNGRDIQAPYYKHTDFRLFPSDAVNGLMELGSFEPGETVVVAITGAEDLNLKERTIQLGYLALDKMAELKKGSVELTDLTRSKTGLSFQYNNTGEKRWLFLPVSYDGGWKATLNGKPCEVKKALGAYLAVELPGGSGSVALRHTTPAKGLGAALSLIGLLGFALLLLWRKRAYAANRKAAAAVYALFLFAFFCAVFLMYGACALMYARDLILAVAARLHSS